jgi:hypothetical protein
MSSIMEGSWLVHLLSDISYIRIQHAEHDIYAEKQIDGIYRRQGE